MQANENVAKKLADLTMKAKLERAELQQEIYEIRNKPRTLANVEIGRASCRDRVLRLV